MDITAIHQIFLTCTSVTTDSRNCPQGSLFIALKGESFNGNAFAARALESGSAYAIVDEEAYAPAGYTIHRGGKQLEDLATTCQLPPSADAYTHHRHYGYKRKDYYQGTDVHRTFANSQRALYLGKFEQSHRCSPHLASPAP